MNEVLVSIVIPCYNGAGTILQSVESCISQTYKYIEVIIVNDGSTDESLSVIEGIASQDVRISAFSQENLGPAYARNFGASKAKGKYIVFLDADDFIAPTFIQECVDVFNTNSEMDIVFSITNKFEQEVGEWRLLDFSPQKILIGNCFPITSMMSLEKFKDIGMFDTQLNHAEDWEMWIRMTNQYPNVFKIPKPLFFYRKRLAKDSITDLNQVHNYADYTHLYIYQKHYELYRKHGYSINDLLWSKEEANTFKRKYYNVWYRKLIYKWKSLIGRNKLEK